MEVLDITEMSKKTESPKAVILCGGRGTRFKEQTEFIPKPMARIGSKPILWHIMKIFSHYGFDDFVLLLGYKSEVIKSYFANYCLFQSDVRVDMSSGSVKTLRKSIEKWSVDLIETGFASLTARRVFLAKDILKNVPYFFLTYGDGVADVDVNALLKFHKDSGRLVTITGYHPEHRFGLVGHDDGKVISFNEKPRMKELINCGFMVFDKEALKYFDGTNIMLEQLLPKIAEDHQLSIFLHEGFWKSMDTQREFEELNNLWDSDPKWRIWSDN